MKGIDLGIRILVSFSTKNQKCQQYTSNLSMVIIVLIVLPEASGTTELVLV